MKKSRILSIFFVLMFLVSIYNVPVAHAASKTKYSYKKVNRSKTFYGEGKNAAKAIIYYKKVVLKGNSKAIKKINKEIDKECNQFLNEETIEDFYSTVKQMIPSGNNNNPATEYTYYATSKVTYNQNGIISIRISTFWWLGGVSNSDRYGLTFDLKTGKKITLRDVTKGSSKTIKNNIIKTIKSDQPVAKTDVVKKTKLKKMDFYLKPNNKAMVCFGPYELDIGGQYREYSIKSKYK